MAKIKKFNRRYVVGFMLMVAYFMLFVGFIGWYMDHTFSKTLDYSLGEIEKGTFVGNVLGYFSVLFAFLFELILIPVIFPMFIIFWMSR